MSLAQLVHPAPAAAVTLLSAALAAILSTDAGRPPVDLRVALTTLGVAGSQITTGAVNDWADRHRDARVQPTKPIPAGNVTPRAALLLAAAGLAIQLVANVPLGLAATTWGVVALASAQTYNLGLSATPYSVVPYLVSFGSLPLWIASGVGVPLERVVPAALLVPPFAAAAHLANAARDFDADAAAGRRNLAQLLGRRASHATAFGLTVAVAAVSAVLFAGSGRLAPVTLGLGCIGLAAVAAGWRSAESLWRGMLVAAVAWTAAWALGTG